MILAVTVVSVTRLIFYNDEYESVKIDLMVALPTCCVVSDRKLLSS